MKVVVYTAIFGNIDKVWSFSPSILGEAQYVCLTDKPRPVVGVWSPSFDDYRPKILSASGQVVNPVQTWEQRVIELEDSNTRKWARYYKAMPQKLFPDADVWIWVDGNLRPKVGGKTLVDKYLPSHAPFATFNHPDRTCVYQEIAACLKAGKGKKAKLATQKRHYSTQGMPAMWGLAETRMVIRRNTEGIRKFNEYWWEHLETFSLRDQVSLPFLCWANNMKWHVIPGRASFKTVSAGNKNNDFWLIKHKDTV